MSMGKEEQEPEFWFLSYGLADKYPTRNTVLIEQAREDAQRMHAATKMQNLPTPVLNTVSAEYRNNVTRDLGTGKYD